MAKCKKGFKREYGKCVRKKSAEMRRRKFTVLDLIIIYVAGIYGIFYLFFPHSIHIRFEPTWIIANNTTLLAVGLPHFAHMTLGVLLIILAIFIIFRRKVL